MPDVLNLAALLQSLVTIAFGGLLAFYANRYWEKYRARNKSQDEAAAKLAIHNEAADTERLALRADADANKAQHTRFQHVDEELHATVRRLEEKLHVVELALLRNDTRNEATKETLARIDGQLSRLIDTFRHRA